MPQPFNKPVHKNNRYSNKAQPVNQKQENDIDVPGCTGKTWLSKYGVINKFMEYKQNDSVIMHDIFGALNY